MLFQAGYLTISSYDKKTELYTLRYPNHEVRQSYSISLLSAITKESSKEVRSWGRSAREALEGGGLETFCSILQAVFARIPYEIDRREEAHYHGLLSMFLMSIELDPECEVMTNRGRIDLTVCTGSYVYVFEIKIDTSAERALKQIEDMKYYERFKEDKNKRTIVLVGLSFNKRKGEDSLSYVSRVI